MLEKEYLRQQLNKLILALCKREKEKFASALFHIVQVGVGFSLESLTDIANKVYDHVAANDDEEKDNAMKNLIPLSGPRKGLVTYGDLNGETMVLMHYGRLEEITKDADIERLQEMSKFFMTRAYEIDEKIVERRRGTN